MSTRPWPKIVGLEIAVLALIVLGIGGLIRGASGADDDDTMASPPVVTVELSTVTPAIAADYHYAADHLADFAQIPCYCGCDRSLNHRISPTATSPRPAHGTPTPRAALCAATRLQRPASNSLLARRSPTCATRSSPSTDHPRPCSTREHRHDEHHNPPS